MTNQKNIPIINNLENLAITIQETNTFFLNKIHKQVNTALTLRNWLVGYYITLWSMNNQEKTGQPMENNSIKLSPKSLQRRV